MDNENVNQPPAPSPNPSRREGDQKKPPSLRGGLRGGAVKRNLGKTLLYTLLIGYGFISLFPFLFMFSTSLMTTSESTSRTGLIPFRDFDIKSGSDISPCIVRSQDTFIDDEGETVTKTRWRINITEEVAAAQGYGNIAGGNVLEEEFLTEIPFLSNYCQAWRRGNLGQFMLNSVKITAIQVVGTLVLSTLAAYAFARMEFIGKNVIFTILLATLMIPGVVTNLPNFLLVNEIGNVFGNEGWFANTFGWEMCGRKNCWLRNWPALTIPFMAPAISIFLMRQHFASIPDELWDAAQIDGAGHLRFLRTVIVPLSRPVILVVTLFTFIAAWNDLGWPLLVTVGDETWRPVAVGLQRFFDTDSAYPALRMAGSMITILPILILYALTQRTFIEGLSQSGLKG